MLRFLVLLMIVVPALEIWGLVTVGRMIGGLNTVLLVILTGVIGAYLAKSQGLRILHEAERKLSYGQLPGQQILDGIAVLVGGVLLLTPGFFTDSIGFLLLFPPTRSIFKMWFLIWLQKKIRSGNFHFHFFRRF